jgi:hypothetical protein
MKCLYRARARDFRLDFLAGGQTEGFKLKALQRNEQCLKVFVGCVIQIHILFWVATAGLGGPGFVHGDRMLAQ